MPEVECELFHADLRRDIDEMITESYGIEKDEVTGTVKLYGINGI